MNPKECSSHKPKQTRVVWIGSVLATFRRGQQGAVALVQGPRRQAPPIPTCLGPSGSSLPVPVPKTHFSRHGAQLHLLAAWAEMSSQRRLNPHPDSLPWPRWGAGGSCWLSLPPLPPPSLLSELSICSVPCQHFHTAPPASPTLASRLCSKTPGVAPDLAGGSSVQSQRWLALLRLGVWRILGPELPEEQGDDSVHT